jgi:hypothetical protein
MAAVSGLVSALDAELVRMGYKPSTMVWYRGCWRRLPGSSWNFGDDPHGLTVTR